MRLINAYIDNFGKFSNTNIDFSSLTQFCKPNGWGKSTLAQFIVCMFFGMDTARKSSKDMTKREKFFPFNGGKFGGSLTFSLGDDLFTVERSFHKTSKAQDQIIVYKNHRLFDEFNDDFGYHIFNMDEDSFIRTVFFNHENMSVVSDSISSMLCGELLDTKSYDDAIKKLETKKRQLKALKGKNDTIHNLQEQIVLLKEQISELTVKADRLDELYNNRKTAVDELNQGERINRLATDMENKKSQLKYLDVLKLNLSNEKNKLGLAQAKYPNGLPNEYELEKIRDNTNQILVLEGKYSQIQEKIDEKWDNVQEFFNDNYPDELELQQICDDHKNIDELTNKIAHAKVNNKKTSLWPGIILLFISLVISFVGGFMPMNKIVKIILACVGCISVVLGIILLIDGTTKRRSIKKQLLTMSDLTKKCDELVKKEQQFIDTFHKGADIDTIKQYFDSYQQFDKNNSQDFLRLDDIKNQCNNLHEQIQLFLDKYCIKNCSQAHFIEDIQRDISYHNKLIENITSLQEDIQQFSKINNLQDIKNIDKVDTNEIIRYIAKLDEEIASVELACESLEDKKNQLQTAIIKLDEAVFNHDIVQKTIQFLSQAKDNLQNKYLLPVQDNFNKYMSLVDENLSLSLDGNFNIIFTYNGSIKSENHLSDGQKCLSAFCLRLAIIDNIFPDSFIILDDPFMYLDKQHSDYMKVALEKIAQSKQIIYFTAHTARQIYREEV